MEAGNRGWSFSATQWIFGSESVETTARRLAGLGYSGINNSLAVQFNVFGGAHFGIATHGSVSDSTGTGAVNLVNGAVGGIGDTVEVQLAYNSSHPTHNAGSYDLWVDLVIGGKTYQVGNWNQ